MPALPIRRKNLKPEDRRNQLVECARTLFSQKGYEATTVADVMKMAGVSKGGFYHHFDSKEALLEALAAQFARESMSHTAEVLDDDQLDPFCKLDRVLRIARAQKADRAPEVIKMFGAAFRPGNTLLFERIRRAIYSIIVPVLSAILEEGARDGTFNVPDPEMAAHLILHLNGATQDLVADALFGASPEQRQVARTQIVRMGTLQGIAIDRLLGLPDGSLVWLDAEALDAIMPPDRTV